MKKNIIFVMSNLECGGAEKALISMLEVFDYSKYNVDLLLFNQKGIFLNKVPKQVNILEEPFGYKYYDMSVKKAITELLSKGKIKYAFGRLVSMFIYKIEKDSSRCNQRVWKYISNMFGKLDKEYDAAIGYLEGHPIYYCVDNVKAKKKIGFIHNDYDKLGLNSIGDREYFKYLDKLITVSPECVEVLKNRFPEYSYKVDNMYNIVSSEVINKMAAENIDIEKNSTKIVTVGRLNKQKGYDLAIEACKLLVDKGYDLKWYVIGEGNERNKLEELIRIYNLKDRVILLGLKENPYPYIKQADIYVQTSRFEGKSIAIDEAKILHKPIVVTNFTTVRDQISDGINGLIVEMNSDCICKGIEKLLVDSNLKEKLVQNLIKESFGNEEEVNKMYTWCI
ncbi:glycosyltransferase [Terrisporobacter glycolicus]|nr:glycosyltransferase [Terrisporobacter glycolicus]